MLANPDQRNGATLATLAESSGLITPSLVIMPLHPLGPAWVVEPRRLLSPASMIKLPIAAALAADWQRGRLSPDEPIEISERDVTTNDLPSPLIPGYRASTRELGELMLTHSDNVATNALIELLNRERITAYARELGLAQTAVRRKLSGSLPLIDDPDVTGRNAHPAFDAATLLCAIASDAVPGSAWFRATLAEQRWNEKLSPGLSPRDRFLHKTGETDEVRHDGGLLVTEDERVWLLVVYTALTDRQGDRPLADFMRALRPLLEEKLV